MKIGDEGVYVSVEASEAMKFQPEVGVYPNPTRDEVNVVVEGDYYSNFSVALYDLRGTMIYQEEKCSEKVSISLSELNVLNGLYVIRINTGNLILNKKIIYLRY